MDIFALCCIALIAAMLSLTLKKYNGEIAIVVSLGASVLIMAAVFSAASPVFEEIGRLYRGTGLREEYGKILLKCLGVGLVCQLAGDTCRDAGETALASKVDIAGRVTVLVLALPMLSQLVEIAIGMMK